MTRKDYVAIAKALQLARLTNPAKAHGLAIDDVAFILAAVFAEDNSRFDRAKFLAAAGVTGNYAEAA